MRINVKLRYRLFQRSNGLFFVGDRVTGKQASLRTRDKAAVQRIFHTKNESHQQPAINLQIARAYLMAVDPQVAKRSWRQVMEEIVKFKQGSTLQRCQGLGTLGISLLSYRYAWVECAKVAGYPERFAQ